MKTQQELKVWSKTWKFNKKTELESYLEIYIRMNNSAEENSQIFS